MQYFLDQFIQQEILNIVVICPFGEYGCNWEGCFEEYLPHVEKCDFAMLTCEHCGEKLHRNWLTAHTETCPRVPKACPLSAMISATTSRDTCTFPVHLGRRAQKRIRSPEDQNDQKEIKESCSCKKLARIDFVNPDGATPSRKLLVSCVRDGELTSSAPQGNMSKCSVIKSCQFMQQKANAENCKYSLSFKHNNLQFIIYIIIIIYDVMQVWKVQ